MLEQEIARLLATVDNGEDVVLPVLADAMEEAGDVRAEGLRKIIADGYKPDRGKVRMMRDPIKDMYAWHRRLSHKPHHSYDLPRRYYNPLPVGKRTTEERDYMRFYHTRSEAFLVLATSIAQSPKGIIWDDFLDRYLENDRSRYLETIGDGKFNFVELYFDIDNPGIDDDPVEFMMGLNASTVHSSPFQRYFRSPKGWLRLLDEGEGQFVPVADSELCRTLDEKLLHLLKLPQ
jgi:hypothetical protein